MANENPLKEYLAVHRPQLEGLLVGAQTLSVTHEPTVVIEQSPRPDLTVIIDGQVFTGAEKDLYDSEERRRGIVVANAQSHLAIFTMRLGLLYGSVSLMSKVDHFANLSPDLQREYLHNQRTRLLRHLSELSVRLTLNTQVAEETMVGSVMAESNRLKARGMFMAVSDEDVVHSLHVEELIGWGNDQSPVQVSEETQPAEDQNESALVEFFEEKGHAQAYMFIQRARLFWMTDDGSHPETAKTVKDILDKLVAQYDGVEAQELRGIIAGVRRSADSTRFARNLLLSNPEMVLPSEDKLNMYTHSLQNMLSQ